MPKTDSLGVSAKASPATELKSITYFGLSSL